MAVSSNGQKITLKNCNDYLINKDKIQLANMIYDRLYGRYLKPFSFPSQDYKINYKNGFALMASCCLLIETYISFTEKDFRNTKNLSAKTFGVFFTTQSRFADLSTGGINKKGDIASIREGGIPNDFYVNVRCGILHNAETKDGWTITRDSTSPYFDPKTKILNATKFANRLQSVLNDYKKRLIKSDFENDLIWLNFKNRLNDLIKHS